MSVEQFFLSVCVCLTMCFNSSESTERVNIKFVTIYHLLDMSVIRKLVSHDHGIIKDNFFKICIS